MPLAIAAGKVNIGSTTMRYIPALYAGKLLKKFYSNTVLSAICNTDYEGEIRKYGDTVHIRATPDITIRDYSKGMTLTNEQPESTAVTLEISKGKYWSFVTERVDKIQTDLKTFVNKWTDDAAEQLKISVDSDVLGNVYADSSAYNQGATAGYKNSNINLGASGAALAVSKTNVLDTFVDCGTVLDEIDCPEAGRFLVISPWIAGLIKKSDLKDASLAGDNESIMRSGYLGRIDRFTLFVSNLLTGTATAGTYCLFGTKDAISFASQLTENETLPNPNGFGTLHRGLQVYGYKVVKPEALGTLYAKKA